MTVWLEELLSPATHGHFESFVVFALNSAMVRLMKARPKVDIFPQTAGSLVVMISDGLSGWRCEMWCQLAASRQLHRL